MYTLEEFLLLDIVNRIELAKVINIEILADDKSELYLTWQDKQGKVYKHAIKTKILGNIVHTFETYVATEMLRQGYVLVPIEGGFEVYGGTEIYQVMKEECTCPYYIYKRNKCIHLIFKDWHMQYRQEASALKRKYHG
jgi:hypothetical protein